MMADHEPAPKSFLRFENLTVAFPATRGARGELRLAPGDTAGGWWLNRAAAIQVDCLSLDLLLLPPNARSASGRILFEMAPISCLPRPARDATNPAASDLAADPQGADDPRSPGSFVDRRAVSSM